MATRPTLADAQLARPPLASGVRGYAPRTKRYGSPLRFRPLRRFSNNRNETRERWIA